MLENQIEKSFVKKLADELKYVYRDDIHDRQELERNFREKFQSLNRCHLTDNEFARLLEEITDADVFSASKKLRERNTFMREDGTPLQYSLVNIKDWCKNDYEVIHQLRINTRNSFQRYDVILLINGLPVVQIELKILDVSPRRGCEENSGDLSIPQGRTPFFAFGFIGGNQGKRLQPQYHPLRQPLERRGTSRFGSRCQAVERGRCQNRRITR